MLLSSICLAASFAVPGMPEAEWDDTEVVTNAALPVVRADSRVFAFSLELDATESNNVEVAFGRDADNDGGLSRAETDLLVGWDCGEWKIVDCATGDETIEQGTEGRVTLDWRLEFNAAYVPREMVLAFSTAAIRLLSLLGVSESGRMCLAKEMRRLAASLWRSWKLHLLGRGRGWKGEIASSRRTCAVEVCEA